MKKKVVLAGVAAVMCLSVGAFAAGCGGGTTPTYHAAKDPTCSQVGNVEYWEKDGKYYSDEACTTEITQIEKPVDSTAHTVTGNWVNDAANHKHYKVCANDNTHRVDEASCSAAATPTYDRDASKHYAKCGTCGGKVDDGEAHTPSGWTVSTEATATRNGTIVKTCTTCEYVIESKTVTYHAEVAATCTTAGSHVYYTMEGSETKYSDAACTTQATNLEIAIDSNAHKWEADYTSDGTKHWIACEYNAAHKKEEADCTGGADYKHNADQHWKECTVCHYNLGIESTVENHDQWEWVVDVEATADTPGSRHEECKTCGEKRNEGTIIPALEAATHYPEVPATCSAKGTREYWLKGGVKYSDADCTNTVTDAELELAINPDAHDAKADWKYDAATHKHYHECRLNAEHRVDEATCAAAATPTYDKDANKHYVQCGTCGNHVDDGEGHTAGAWVLTVTADATKNGTITNSCSDCGQPLETKTVLYHAATPETCGAAATIEHYTIQGEDGVYYSDPACNTPLASIEGTPATGNHDYEWVVTIVAVDGQNGNVDHKCTVCGDIESSKAVIYHKEAAATCLETGKIAHYTVDGVNNVYYSDAACEHEITSIEKDPVEAALGHNWIWVYDKNPTETEEGISHQECTRCDARQNENTTVPPTADREIEKVDTVPATCITDGVKEHYIVKNGDGTKYSDLAGTVVVTDDELRIPAHGNHVAGDEYGYDADGHWLVCTVDKSTLHAAGAKEAHKLDGKTHYHADDNKFYQECVCGGKTEEIDTSAYDLEVSITVNNVTYNTVYDCYSDDKIDNGVSYDAFADRFVIDTHKFAGGITVSSSGKDVVILTDGAEATVNGITSQANVKVYIMGDSKLTLGNGTLSISGELNILSDFHFVAQVAFAKFNVGDPEGKTNPQVTGGVRFEGSATQINFYSGKAFFMRNGVNSGYTIFDGGANCELFVGAHAEVVFTNDPTKPASQEYEHGFNRSASSTITVEGKLVIMTSNGYSLHQFGTVTVKSGGVLLLASPNSIASSNSQGTIVLEDGATLVVRRLNAGGDAFRGVTIKVGDNVVFGVKNFSNIGGNLQNLDGSALSADKKIICDNVTNKGTNGADGEITLDYDGTLIIVFEGVVIGKQHVSAKAATCTEEGNSEYWIYEGKYYSDAACTNEIDLSETVIAIDPDAHSWRTVWAYNDAQHYHECEYNSEHRQDYGAHSYSWVETIRATDGQNGLLEYKCVCGRVQESKTVIYHAEVPATCGTAGVKQYYTIEGESTEYADSICNTELVDRVIPATGVHVAGPDYSYTDDSGHWILCISDMTTPHPADNNVIPHELSHMVKYNAADGKYYKICICGYEMEEVAIDSTTAEGAISFKIGSDSYTVNGVAECATDENRRLGISYNWQTGRYSFDASKLAGGLTVTSSAKDVEILVGSDATVAGITYSDATSRLYIVGNGKLTVNGRLTVNNLTVGDTDNSADLQVAISGGLTNGSGVVNYSFLSGKVSVTNGGNGLDIVSSAAGSAITVGQNATVEIQGSNGIQADSAANVTLTVDGNLKVTGNAEGIVRMTTTVNHGGKLVVYSRSNWGIDNGSLTAKSGSTVIIMNSASGFAALSNVSVTIESDVMFGVRGYAKVDFNGSTLVACESQIIVQNMSEGSGAAFEAHIVQGTVSEDGATAA